MIRLSLRKRLSVAQPLNTAEVPLTLPYDWCVGGFAVVTFSSENLSTCNWYGMVWSGSACRHNLTFIRTKKEIFDD